MSNGLLNVGRQTHWNLADPKRKRKRDYYFFLDGTGIYDELPCVVKTTDDLIVFEPYDSDSKFPAKYRIVNVTHFVDVGG